LKKIVPAFFKWLLGITGGFAVLLLVLSFTDIPYFAYYYLGTSSPKITHDPDLIVVLGGAGMPSPDGLIRVWYASNAAREYKKAQIIIALPYNENGKDSLHQLDLMARELIVKGIDSSRIHYEPLGFNTRSQALNVAAGFAGSKGWLYLLVVTSPEHMYRSVKTFQKAGFAHVEGLPTFEVPIDEERARDKEDAKDPRVKNLAFRYNMWSYLSYELLVFREYSAITYYKLKGWI
jgi:uncharacterized SAM-binding protein YcdF (DUF218 family)